MKRIGIALLTVCTCGLLAAEAGAVVPTYTRIITLANPSPGDSCFVVGISNAGNAFGWREEPFVSQTGVQWLARTAYAAEDIGGGWPENLIEPYSVNGAGIATGPCWIVTQAMALPLPRAAGRVAVTSTSWPGARAVTGTMVLV